MTDFAKGQKNLIRVQPKKQRETPQPAERHTISQYSQFAALSLLAHKMIREKQVGE